MTAKLLLTLQRHASTSRYKLGLRVGAGNCVVRSMSMSGAVIQAQSGKKYRLVAPLSSEGNEGPHVWKAVDIADVQQQFVVKCPKSDNCKAQNFAAFQHELRMQKLFHDAPLIRPLLDFVPGCSAKDLPPWMVLEGFEKTLWTARQRRELSLEEIRWIMKDVLLGLWTIHREGLVYSGKNHNGWPLFELVSLASRPQDGECCAQWISRQRAWQCAVYCC